MKKTRIIDKTSLVLGAAFFFFALILFYRDTGMFFDSLLAALLSGGLIWGTYIILRICFLAARR